MLPFLYVKETGFMGITFKDFGFYLTVGKTKSMSGSSFTIKNALSAPAEGAFFTFRRIFNINKNRNALYVVPLLLLLKMNKYSILINERNQRERSR